MFLDFRFRSLRIVPENPVGFSEFVETDRLLLLESLEHILLVLHHLLLRLLDSLLLLRSPWRPLLPSLEPLAILGCISFFRPLSLHLLQRSHQRKDEDLECQINKIKKERLAFWKHLEFFS